MMTAVLGFMALFASGKGRVLVEELQGEAETLRL